MFYESLVFAIVYICISETKRTLSFHSQLITSYLSFDRDWNCKPHVFIRIATPPVAMAMLLTSHTSSKQIEPIDEYVHQHKWTLAIPPCTSVSQNYFMCKNTTCRCNISNRYIHSTVRNSSGSSSNITMVVAINKWHDKMCLKTLHMYIVYSSHR